MKRICNVLLALCMVLGMAACSSNGTEQPQEPVEPKTATATMQGFGGDVTVTLTVEGDKITDVQMTGDKESATLGGKAVQILPERMMANNKVSVDKVTGATITSSVAIAAAKDALEQMGVTEDSLAKVEPEAINTDTVTADVIVIGGGGAGIAAATTAGQAGKDVVLIEKLGILGGDTALSGGVRIRAKVDGDPEDTMTEDQLYDFYMERTHYLSDPEVIRTYVDSVTESMAWADNLGNGIGETVRFRTNPESIMALQPANDGGRGLITTMTEGLEEAGVEVYLNSRAQEFIQDETGKVIGVKVLRENGEVQEFRSNGGVVLACGGFGNNAEMLKKYSTPGADRVVNLCSIGGEGDGIVMGEKIGAAIRFAEDWDNNGTNSELTPAYMVAFPTTDAVLVNNKGKRFITEDEQRPHIYKAMRLQLSDPEINKFWFIFDSTTVQDGADELVEKGSAIKADTLEELADMMEIDKEAFFETIENYNNNKGKDDPEMGKPAKFMKGVNLEAGPFYAAKTWPLRTTTVGGIVINKDAEVLDNNDQPIPALYAAGAVANYTFFNSNNPTCGSAVSNAVVFGRIAGANAAALAE